MKKYCFSCDIGIAAIDTDATASKFKCSTQLERIGTSRLDGRYRSMTPSRIDLVFHDDWGYSAISVNAQTFR